MEEILAGKVKRGGGKLDYSWVVFTRSSRTGEVSPATATYWLRNPVKVRKDIA